MDAVRYELTPSEEHYDLCATLHGGIIPTLLDTAMTAAAITTLLRGQSCAQDEKSDLKKTRAGDES